MAKHCFFCGEPVDEYEFPRSVSPVVSCQVCGEYRITERAIAKSGIKHNQIISDAHFYSGAVRELNSTGITPLIKDFGEFLDSVKIPSDPLESIDKILLYLGRTLKTADGHFEYYQSDYPIGYAGNFNEFATLLAMAEDLNYVQSHNNTLFLRLEGWQRLRELKTIQATPSQAFVAMWFDENLKEVWEQGFKPALLKTGFTPLRIEPQQNEKVDDRIIVEIRKSGLVIADFTGNRGGVYFEAGFAMGLGLPLIWTCRADDMENAHFDARQFNHIIWKTPDDLREQLINRIEATLPSRVGRLI